MKGKFGGGPLLVGGLGPGPPAPPLKSGPSISWKRLAIFSLVQRNRCESTNSDGQKLTEKLLQLLIILLVNNFSLQFSSALK